MSNRETIFKGIREALADLPEPASYPNYEPKVMEPIWLAHELDLVPLFRRRFSAAGGKFFDSIGKCGEWLKAEKIKLLYIAPGLDALASSLSGIVPITRDYSRSQVDEIDAALTCASGGIAETGSIVLADSDTPDRLSALAPWRHIAVFSKAALHRTIGDAIASLPVDPNVIWVTGPSKTADVEGILIQGVHGPGEQCCIIL